MKRRRAKSRRWFLWAAALALAGPLSRGEPSPSPRTPARSEPFSLGERLIYDVEWSPPWFLFFLPVMRAGEASLSIEDGGEADAVRSLKVTFTARSSGTFSKLVGIDVNDHFQSIVDPETLCTRSVHKRIREGNRRRDVFVSYFPAEARLHIRALNAATNPPKVDRDESVAVVPSCVRDVFSALYDTRRRNLEAGASYRLTVGDDDLVKEVEARVEKRESVNVPAGRYEAWKVNTVALLGGLFKEGGQFKIWMTADERQIPVKFEVKVKLGRVSGALRQYSVPAVAERGRSQP